MEEVAICLGVSPQEALQLFRSGLETLRHLLRQNGVKWPIPLRRSLRELDVSPPSPGFLQKLAGLRGTG